MRLILTFLAKFLIGVLAGGGLILILYCLMLPAEPFVYVGF